MEGKSDEDRYHKKKNKLTTNEQVRDIEKVGLAGSSLAPVCLRVKVEILIPDILGFDLPESIVATSSLQANDDLKEKEKQKNEAHNLFSKVTV